jgi:hypothetical protein
MDDGGDFCCRGELFGRWTVVMVDVLKVSFIRGPEDVYNQYFKVLIYYLIWKRKV